MQYKIWIKFLIIYLLFAFVSIFALEAIIPVASEKILIKGEGSDMYREATVIAGDYMTRYYNGEVNESVLKKELEPVCAYLGSSIWLMETGGKVLMSSGTSYTGTAPETIEAFDPLAITGSTYITGNFYDTFAEEVLTVCAPITVGFKTAGYVLIHTPLQSKIAAIDSIMKIVLVAFLIVFLLSLSLLAAYFYFVHFPLKKIIKAAKEFSNGNLEYTIPVETTDEIGYLALSLNDMAHKLNDLEDTQKKFIANVSHDFRSPLTSIKGYSEAMADGTIPPEHAKKYLDIIIFEAERLTDLTRDLLTLSDLTSRGKKLNIETFNINEMIKKTAISFQGRCLEHKIEIDLVFAEHESYVKADRAKLQQVFYNLIDNAIKFSHDDSVITIETTLHGNRMIVSIKDDGIGIPRDSLDKIWDRFYKTDQSRGKDKKGTGLGLAIVKEIIQAHGENINVISTEGVGTEFIFTLTKGQKS